MKWAVTYLSTGKRSFLIKMRLIIFVRSFENDATVCPGKRLCHSWLRHATLQYMLEAE